MQVLASAGPQLPSAEACPVVNVGLCSAVPRPVRSAGSETWRQDGWRQNLLPSKTEPAPPKNRAAYQPAKLQSLAPPLRLPSTPGATPRPTAQEERCSPKRRRRSRPEKVSASQAAVATATCRTFA